ncbi:hypothetical protein [Sphingomonas sp.]|uniref:hypothetical protein n=1 Tax=Sphingomonas sp. TaxID=28214 RepID=UPI0025CD5D99|nr:hypothetical protein [Sphingomonas sp.]
MMRLAVLLGLITAAASATASPAEKLPAAVSRELPAGYTVLAFASARPDPRHLFYVVALAAHGETIPDNGRAPDRPLLIFQQRSGGGYAVVGRNDGVVLRADQGGQCDPFEDGSITANGAYVTVENGVACGSHWTDYITFRFDPRAGYVFSTERLQSWSSNPDTGPNAAALVPDGERVIRPVKGRRVPFSAWRRKADPWR